MTGKDRWFSSPTQVFWACKALIEGRTISHNSKIHEAKGWRLAAILEQLKNNYSWPIIAASDGPENIAYFRLPEGTSPATPIYPPSEMTLANEVAK